MKSAPHMKADVCIAGGVPAGMMLGVLLARAGIQTTVLEKHSDFFRDFRGDTVHPSTLEIIHRLGWLDAFLKRPHQKLDRIAVQIEENRVHLADFRHLGPHCKFIAFMPQWEFLDFLRVQASSYPNFHLLMKTEAVDLIRKKEAVCGVIGKSPRGKLHIDSPLVIAADGRHSILREKAKLKLTQYGAPMDVLWMRISKRKSDPQGGTGQIQRGQIVVMLDRGDYWQMAFIIKKGRFNAIKKNGICSFRDTLSQLIPFLGDRTAEIRTFSDIRLLEVAVNRLEQWWKPGVLCIGDAAHAMSPVGGVGINLAIQDAVAAANVLIPKLLNGTLTVEHLRQVQRRRELPTILTQKAQLMIQNRIINRTLSDTRPLKLSPLIQLAQVFPWLQRIPATLIGSGVRPEYPNESSIFLA